MKILRALTTEDFDQLKAPSDFNWTEPGELLVLGFVCDTGSNHHSCGCERSFTGINTLKATTIGRVDEGDLVTEFAKSEFFKVWGRHVRLDVLTKDTLELSRYLDHFETGELVRIKSTKTRYTLYKHEKGEAP